RPLQRQQQPPRTAKLGHRSRRSCPGRPARPFRVDERRFRDVPRHYPGAKEKGDRSYPAGPARMHRGGGQTKVGRPLHPGTADRRNTTAEGHEKTLILPFCEQRIVKAHLRFVAGFYTMAIARLAPLRPDGSIEYFAAADFAFSPCKQNG